MSSLLRQLRFLLQITRSNDILRRYFVVNGFDGALTMLGLNVGFYLGNPMDPSVALTACLGAAIALGMSGLTSAYISETAERMKWLNELENAMLEDISNSAHAIAARVVPVLVAAVNGLAPLLIALFITLPWWLARRGIELEIPPVEAAIGLAFFSVFGLGAYLGQVSGTSLIWSGIKAMLTALATTLLIVLFVN